MAMLSLKQQEIVCITKAAAPDAGYLVHSLLEERDGEGAQAKTTFKLSTLAAPEVPSELLNAHFIGSLPEHLACDRHRQLHVVISTLSGLGHARAFYDNVLGPLLTMLGLAAKPHGDDDSEVDHEYRILVTQDKHSVRDLARRLFSASPRRRQTVLLLSGDGGVVDFLNSLPDDGEDDERRPIIGLLPMGTGNALFHSLHKPLYANGDGASAFVLGLRTCLTGRGARLPTFVADFSPGSRLVAGTETADDAEARGAPVARLRGAIVASYGFHASLVWESDTAALRTDGAARFGMAAQTLVALEHAYDCVVEVRRHGGDGDWVRLRPKAEESDGDGRFGYVLATLVSNLEKTFTISPASKPLDGRLRLVTFGDVGGEKTMEIMQAAYQDGAHVQKSETVGYDDVDDVKIEVREDGARWRKVCVDGTIVGLPRGGCMRVRRDQETRLMVLVHRAVSN